MYFAYGETECSYLRQKDKRLCAVIDRIGHIERAVDTDLFSSVVHHIIGQQISTKAQATIWCRCQDTLGEVNAEAILTAGVPKLQSLGMTFRKAEYITDFAEKVHTGVFSLDAVAHMDDEDAIRALSSLKGIGVWTAEMILLFCLQRPDIFSLQFSAGCAWSTITGRSTAGCLKNIAAAFTRIAAWPACICGRSRVAQFRK